MENYKIKVNDKAESKEAQELFFELGYSWYGNKKQVSYLEIIDKGEFSHLLAWSVGSFEKVIQMGCGSEDAKELTLSQLRTMVVLHRNDVNDANLKLFISPSQGCLSLYKASDDVFYVYADKSKCWDKSRSVGIKNKDLEPIQDSKKDEQVLISGADALRALADGKEVEFFYRDVWDSIGEMIVIDHFTNDKFKFRIKPRTITLNGIEIPAPFEPKEFEDCYMLTDLYEHGYVKTSWKYSKSVPAWSTEEEIKQVVAALRQGFKL